MAKQEAKDPRTANTSSEMQGDFNLANGLLSVANLHYDVPGANINLDGVYSLDGNKFDFFGTAALKASLSQMVGGWKGFFLKPVDRFFRKNGNGLEVPIKITGTKSEPHFGLDLHHDDAQEQKAATAKEVGWPFPGKGRRQPPVPLCIYEIGCEMRAHAGRRATPWERLDREALEYCSIASL